MIINYRLSQKEKVESVKQIMPILLSKFDSFIKSNFIKLVRVSKLSWITGSINTPEGNWIALISLKNGKDITLKKYDLYFIRNYELKSDKYLSSGIGYFIISVNPLDNSFKLREIVPHAINRFNLRTAWSDIDQLDTLKLILSLIKDSTKTKNGKEFDKNKEIPSTNISIQYYIPSGVFLANESLDESYECITTYVNRIQLTTNQLIVELKSKYQILNFK